MPLSPQEQQELDRLEIRRLEAKKRAALSEAPKGIPKDTLSGKRKPAPQEVDKPRDAGGLLADIAMEGGGAAAGQAIGALPVLSVPTFGLSVPAGGAIGGLAGNIGSQVRRIKADEQDGFRVGEALGSILTGAIPGASAGASGTRAMLREGGKQAAGGVLARTLETGVDEGRLPSGAELAMVSTLPAVGGALAQRAESKAATRAGTKGATERATLEAARKAGYKVPPSDLRPGIVTDSLSSFGGKAALAQQATIGNQEITNRLAKRILNVPESTDITPEVLSGIRKDAAKPYQELEEIANKAASEKSTLEMTTTGGSAHETEALRAIPEVAEKLKSLRTQAGADIRAWREALQRRNDFYEDYRKNKTVAALDSARENEALAETLAERIETAAAEIGRPELAAQIVEGRKRIAQTWDIERALNESNADVIATELGKAARRGAPLSGELKTIADFDRAFGQRLTREAAKVPAPGVSALNPVGAALAASAGSAAAGPVGALAGLYPLLRQPVRSLLLSEPYQNFATRIPSTGILSPQQRAILARTLIQEGAQEIADEVEPKKKTKDSP
jgi:hypothetical protein